MKATFQAMYFIGSVLGTLIFGILADFLGRLPMLALANVFGIVGNLLTVYLPPNIWFLGFARFIAGLATDTNFFMMYIIGKLKVPKTLKEKNTFPFFNECKIIYAYIFFFLNFSYGIY